MPNRVRVSASAFTLLRAQPALGRALLAADDRLGAPPAAVLSYGFWQEHYGGTDSAIGSTLSLYSHPVEVIGVAPPGFYGMDEMLKS